MYLGKHVAIRIPFSNIPQLARKQQKSEASSGQDHVLGIRLIPKTGYFHADNVKSNKLSFSMRLLFAVITTKTKSEAFALPLQKYMELLDSFTPAQHVLYRSEYALFESLQKQRSRTAPLLVLLDSRGRQFSSEQFADWLGMQRDQGQQSIVFAIGPADGWSEEARKRAHLLLSLGPMTLPHELARVVLSEQIYRAFTILSGHPYHTGH